MVWSGGAAYLLFFFQSQPRCELFFAFITYPPLFFVVSSLPTVFDPTMDLCIRFDPHSLSVYLVSLESLKFMSTHLWSSLRIRTLKLEILGF